MKRVITFSEEGVIKECPSCGQSVLVKESVSECPICHKDGLVVDDSEFKDGKASRMLLMKSEGYDPDKLPAHLRNETTVVAEDVPCEFVSKHETEVATVNVHMFVESGVLKICPKCGETMLVGNNVERCPLCGSDGLEVDNSFFEGGHASRQKLADDWMYSPSPCQVVNMSIKSAPQPKPSENGQNKPLAPIISIRGNN